jgi:hypothetical protein
MNLTECSFTNHINFWDKSWQLWGKMRTLDRLFVATFNFVVLALACGFASLVYAQSGEVTLKPTADAYVDSLNPTSNYGGQDYLQIRYWEGYPNNHESIVWLKFNLSSVPDGAVVDVATLQLYAYLVGETFSVQTHSCYDNTWKELTLKYSNMPSYNTTSTDSVFVAADSQWYNWNVTDAVRNASSGNPKTVTIVMQELAVHTSASNVSFYSKEAQVYLGNDYAPKLSVHWSSVVPELPSLLILSLFMIGTLTATIFCKARAAYHVRAPKQQ